MGKTQILLLLFIYITIKCSYSSSFAHARSLSATEHHHRPHRCADRCPKHHHHGHHHIRHFQNSLHKSQPLAKEDGVPRSISLSQHFKDLNPVQSKYSRHNHLHHLHANKSSKLVNSDSVNSNLNLNITRDHHHYHHNASQQNHIDSVVCQKCARASKVHVTEEELTELRIEFVKKQILEKLRLKERPKISVDSLPLPLYEGSTILNNQKTEHKDLDNYYARTNQRFIFLEEEHEKCRRVKHGPSMCFHFNTDEDLDHTDVASAELWAYRQADNASDKKRTQMYVVSELSQKLSEKYLPKVKPIAINSSGIPEGWIKIDIVWPIKNRVLHVSCPSCELSPNKTLFSTDKFHRPFIVLDTRSRQKQRRQKRNVNCSAGVTECCREKLYISFAEIGWGDWIIHPKGYDAYFCRGSCSTAATVAMSNTPYSSILRKVMYSKESSGNRPLELTPCCTAKQFSSLELVYMDSNRTGTVKTLPNMIIEACGCM